MASRTKQKEEARSRRLAEEQAREARERRQRRMRMLSGVVLAAVAVIVVAIAISSSGGGGSAGLAQATQAKQVVSSVQSLLSGIPQSGNQIGSPAARVTVTEYGDLQCPVCKDFALGAQEQLISKDVRSGRVKLVYRSLPTATANGPNPSVFPTQQAAALAAGEQNLGWQYIELFYHQQGTENTSYVTDAYLNGLARQVPGLNYTKWSSDRNNPALTTQVSQDEQAASAKGYNSTPTIIVSGPKGTASPIVGATDYTSLESAISSAA